MNFFVFDVDKTIFKVNSSFKYYFFLVTKKNFSKRSFFKVLKYLFYLNSPPEIIHEKIFFEVLKGKKSEDIFKYVDDFLEDILFNFLNEKVFYFLNLAKKRGELILLVSNSPEFLIEKIAKKLSVKNYAATLYENDQFGRLSNIKIMMTADKKVEYVLDLADKFKILKKDIFLFTDSIWDLPLLKISGHSYVINPNNKLKKIAITKGWNIL